LAPFGDGDVTGKAREIGTSPAFGRGLAVQNSCTNIEHHHGEPMRVDQLMSKPVITCSIDDHLHSAAQLMWEHDCGAIPVVNPEGRLVGIVTDRDICMAAYTQGNAPQAIPVSTAMARDVRSCCAGDSVEVAEQLMREGQIRRIPIVDDEGHPIGLVSLHDITRKVARAKKRNGAPDREVVNTLAAICEPRSREPSPSSPTAA
jgi:CBS domain-containing protein